MLRCVLLSKIHFAVVSDARVDYDGSVTIPPEVMDAAGLIPHEQVLIANVRNGARFTTYAIAGAEPAHFCLNGAAARLGAPGDRIIILAFAWMDEKEARSHVPRVVHMNDENGIVRAEGPERV